MARSLEKGVRFQKPKAPDLNLFEQLHQLNES
jgi:hypothetical protein